MRLKDTRIRTRLMGGYAIFTVIILVAGLVNIKNQLDTNSRANEITNVSFQKAMVANTVLTTLLKMDREIGNVVNRKDASGMEQVAGDRAAYKAALERLEKLEADKKGKEIIEQFKTAIAQGREGNLKLAKMVEEGKWDDAIDVFRKVVDPSIDTFVPIVTDLVKYQEDAVQVKYKQIVDSNRTGMVLSIIFGMVALSLAVGATYVVTSSITVPIGRVVKVTEKLAEGKLDVDLYVDRKDEFGEQAASMKTMVEKWRVIVQDVLHASGSVAATSTQLSSSAGQMSKGAGDQAERAHQVATAAEEMSQTVEDIAQNATSIAATATKAATIAKDGGQTVEEAVKEVKEIAVTVGESAGHIASLADLSKKIGDIIGIINEIADQTNLLALNAAIEAARAGEHGRGFAVVADEVRKLAERTTGATSEVSGIIREIQAKVTSAVSSIEHVTVKVDKGVDLSSKAGSELQTIVKSVEELHLMVQQIATAIEEMSATSDQISKDIESISGISSDTSQSSNEVLNASNELARLGLTLQDAARQFEV